ncbi:hypothetical protein SAZ11_62935 [Streptomyces sp. FXJ1.4098]|nr:hypothetical protein [Streptomyces sp. FXJ1.4098]
MDRITATRVGRVLENFNLTWIEEPLDAYDAEGTPPSRPRSTPPSPPARC